MKLEELTKEVIFETLEKMFFSIVEFEGEDNVIPMPYRTAHISLHSESETILIVISLEMSYSRQITADFLGKIVDETTDSEAEDCIKELTNMIGGGIIARLGGNFRSDLPQSGEPPVESKNLCQGENVNIVFYILGSPVGNVQVHRATKT